MRWVYVSTAQPIGDDLGEDSSAERDVNGRDLQANLRQDADRAVKTKIQRPMARGAARRTL